MITKILNDEERKMFNKIYEIKSEIVFIKKSGNRYYVSINANKYIRLKSGVAKLFIWHHLLSCVKLKTIYEICMQFILIKSI